MKESPYENAFIVLLSYIIGFSTAFIAFGVGGDPLNDDIKLYQDTYVKPVKEIAAVAAVEKETGLFVSVNGRERLVTANQASLLEGTYPELTNGFYNELFNVTVSPSGQFVYYCEQLAAESETCDPIIYDTKKDVLHRVQVGEESIAIENHKADWLPSGKLQVNDFISTTETEPWK